MNRSNRQVLVALVLAAVGTLIWQSEAAVQGIQQFAKTNAVSNLSATIKTQPVLAHSLIECATISSLNDTWRSFSFINKLCILSDSPYCASIGADNFKKVLSLNAANLGETIAVPIANLGYEQLIDVRRFWVFQQRKNGAVSFARNWTEYEQGFGNITEFWSGVKFLNSFTRRGNITMRLETATLGGLQFTAEWSNFTVGDASTNYMLQYGSYISSRSNFSEDPLNVHRGMQFSTFDKDNDLSPLSCSVSYGNSGFWYNYCFNICPNGLYSTVEMASENYMSCFQIVPEARFRTLRDIRMMVQIN